MSKKADSTETPSIPPSADCEEAPVARSARKERARSRFYRIVSLERTPAILAVLLAATAWCVSRVADRVVALPLLEYSDSRVSPQVLTRDRLPNCPASEAGKMYVYEISDISKQSAFSHITLEFRSEAKRPVTEVDWVNLPPGVAGAHGDAGCKAVTTQSFRTLTLNELEPGWSGKAVVWTLDDTRPLLLYTQLHGDAGQSGSERPAIYLIKDGLTTWIVRNEFAIYYCSIGGLLILICWYLWTYEKHK